MASLVPLLSRIHFGAFDLDVASGELRKSGISIKLRRQAVEVLIMLTNRAGQVVTREEIRERLWSNDTFVDFERSINFCINQIRGALGDNAETPRYVETLPRQGYRFITPVTIEVRSVPTTPLTVVPRMDSEPAVKRYSLPAWIRPAKAAGAIIGLVPVILLAVVLPVKFAPDWLFGILPRSDDHILIWKIGSPLRGDVPDATVPVDLQEAAQKLGLQIAMETYAAKGFALRFTNAIKRKAEPDVLAFDNYGVLEGIPTTVATRLGLPVSEVRLGSFEGIPVSDRKALISVSESLQSLEDEQGGWEFLIATSHNFGKAKDLALNKITCNGRSAGLVTDPALLSEITGPTLYAIFAGAFGGNTGMAISSLFGEDSVLRDSPKVNDIRICGIWGNRRLAFVNTAILFQSATALGQRSSLVVLTRASSSWELKLISRDVRIISKLSEQLPKLANDTDGGHLQPPSLRDPPDQARLPRFPESERPVLEWDNSGLQTAAYLVESQFEESPAAWSDSAFELVLQRAPRTIRVGAPFGVGMQPHRWRIWAIDKNGGTAISGWRTINYTN